MRIKGVALAAVVSALLLTPAAWAKPDVTIAPADTPGVGNCFPFGSVAGDGPWTPYFAFFYKDMPKFKLSRGDRIAFDLGARNVLDPSADPRMEIAMARMAENGETDEAEPFKRVVTNKVTPRNPRGDTTIGNFELGYAIQSKFKFAGGGLGIRFSNPTAAYAADDTCDEVLVVTTDADASGFFVGRAIADPDGGFPWTNFDNGSLGGFRLQFAPQTKIKKGPKGETDETDAAFKFKSSDPGSKFKCRLDKGRFKRCKKRKSFKNLDPGKHVLKVKAKDSDGLIDRTPAKRKWEIVP